MKRHVPFAWPSGLVPVPEDRPEPRRPPDEPVRTVRTTTLDLGPFSVEEQEVTEQHQEADGTTVSYSTRRTLVRES